MIIVAKSIAVAEFSQTVVAPFVPAFATGEILTVATEVAFGHGEVPVMVYVNVEFDAPTEGVNIPVAATNVPPVPVVRVHVPPVC